ncbi:aspartyl protease family protein 1 isoform X2 [Prosopis cineraria]|uniref:aspartyl protease family protein 1 isoform X2 n=1 Tax=Prosopis cineraria TaxID=364024 RepID=UPI00240F95F6|nr:aspartyl protease family protein 1 isoform X2 [Prosopis cineraria]
MAHPFSRSLLCRLLFLVMSLASQRCYCVRTFEFDVHHRFSDPVKGILGVQDLPEKGSREYYVAMSHRDRIFRGRGLVGGDRTVLTFADGNETYRLSSFGYLHYANVSVGTPALSFLVALDTGSDLFWLPCNCTSCVQSLQSGSGQTINLSIYGPEASSTSKNVLCNSTFCELQRQCPSSGSSCPYQIQYLSNGTSSSGVLVEDVLHLITDDDQTQEDDARITFGCGQIQTGSFLSGAAPNGLFGLGMQSISVPSILAKGGLTSNSFSMCFGADGVGRIRFGDNGSSDQGKTPFNLRASQPTYNISITQIIVGGNATDLEFYAIFDSGTSFTYLNDPAYTQITTSFNSMIKENRHSSGSGEDLPFEFCYDLSSNQTNFEVPMLNLTMKGGDNYYVINPLLVLYNEDVPAGYCLGIVKSDDVNIIGQNFMTGYSIVFDRDNMILGWKESNCYDDVHSNSSKSPTNKSPTPALAVNPEDTSNQSNSSPYRNPFTFIFIVVLFPLLAII